jgi:predicted GNAT family acetyltransferase
MTEAEPTFRDNPDEFRYELHLDGRLIGRIDYRVQPDGVALVHTEIDPPYRGRGLGTRLVAAAVRDLRERDLGIIAICPFVTAYLRRHPGN